MQNLRRNQSSLTMTRMVHASLLVTRIKGSVHHEKALRKLPKLRKVCHKKK